MIVLPRFEKASFDNYECTTNEQQRLVETLRRGVQNGFDRNIVILGSVGTGKTHLAFAVKNALSKVDEFRGMKFYTDDRCAYMTAKTLIDDIHEAWKDRDCENPVYKLTKTDLLILDEMGLSQNERTELYDLINARYERCKPMICISNNTKTELQKVLGQRIYDRISGGAEFFEISGESYRQKVA
jgi:DNA replication protein DnaC